jgi:hypothetical protein
VLPSGSFLAPCIDAAFPGQGNACGLALAGMLPLHCRDAKEQAGDEIPDRPRQVDLLGDDDHPYAPLAPVYQHIDPFAHVLRQPVQLPDHHGLHVSCEDGALQALQGRTLQGDGACVVLELLSGFIVVPRQPGFHFGALRVCLLVSAISCTAAGCRTMPWVAVIAGLCSSAGLLRAGAGL